MHERQRKQKSHGYLRRAVEEKEGRNASQNNPTAALDNLVVVSRRLICGPHTVQRLQV